MAEPTVTTPAVPASVLIPGDLNLGSANQAYRLDFAWPLITGVDTTTVLPLDEPMDSMDLQVVNNSLIIVCNDYTYAARETAYVANQAALDALRAQVGNGYTKEVTWGGIFGPPFQAALRAKAIALDAPTFYSITSPNDSAYATAQYPMAVTRWTQSRGQGRIYHMGKGRKVSIQQLAGNYSYLRVPSALKNGYTYVITQSDGRTARFVYHEDYTISRAIKVNQNGYALKSTKRYAYLGLWHPGVGPIDFRNLDGTAFQVVDCNTQAVAYSGTIRLNNLDAWVNMSGNKRAGWGENLMELDISGLTTAGEYYIRIATIGRSWPFYVHNEAAGRGYFMHLHGLWRQRSGHALDAQYTGWPRPLAHSTCYEHFEYAPEYKAYDPNVGTTYKQPPVSNFAAIQWGETNLPQVEYTPVTVDGKPAGVGGWYDAADYDKRTFHYDVMHNLFVSYEMNPSMHLDGQANHYDSANGVPDIIDEMVWGLTLWRHSQDPTTGGVSGHCEARSHPDSTGQFPTGRPHDDALKYYLSARTRATTFQYAAAAAHLARLLRDFKQADADKWMDSALKAYAFAANPANTFTRLNYCGSGQEYTESTIWTNLEWFGAAVEMFKATRIQSYLDTANSIYSTLGSSTGLGWPTNPVRHHFWYAFYGLTDRAFDQVRAMSIRDGYVGGANIIYTRLTAAGQYRNTIGLTEPFAPIWGRAIAMWDAAVCAWAYALTKDQKWVDACSLAADWCHGCNPQGLSFTSCVGYHYPWAFFQGDAEEDGIIDPVPGITVYGPTGGVPWTHRQTGINFATRDGSVNPAVWTINTRLGPDYIYYSDAQPQQPYWRTWMNGYHDDAGLQEYTIQETISPAIAVYATLLAAGWQPGNRLKSLAPKDPKYVCGLWVTP